jgi:hypothetical protein
MPLISLATDGNASSRLGGSELLPASAILLN